VKHVRILGLCLVAALALGAYVASGASALEWAKCVKVEAGTGNYGPPGNCAKSEKAKPKGTGEYELEKATEVKKRRMAEGKPGFVPFEGESLLGGGKLTTGLRECELPKESGKYQRVTREACKEGREEDLELEEPLFVECATEEDYGHAEAPNKVGNIQVTFKGCKALGSIPCESFNAKEAGKIVTNELRGKLVYYETHPGKAVGLLLEPKAHHKAFAEFQCSTFLGAHVGVGDKKTGAEYTNSGCYGTIKNCPGTKPEEESHGGYDQIISTITPVNEMTKTYKQVYTQEPHFPYKNQPECVKGCKHLSVLEDYLITEQGEQSDWSPAGEVISVENESEEEGEIHG
jgi:hypothetical protein